MRAVVLDTSAILRLTQEEIEYLSKENVIFAPKSVVSELKKSASLLHFSSFRNKISILSPRRRIVKEVLKLIIKANKKLSEADIDVISLAYELKKKGYDVVVLTEDYEIQNALSLLGIAFLSIKGKNIRYVTIFKKKCKACGFIYDMMLDECPNCGSSEFIVIKKVIKNVN